MSTPSQHSDGEQRQEALFEFTEPVSPRLHPMDADRPVESPRLRTAQRNQIELRACDLDSLLAADHPARTVWTFVQGMDLQELYARIRSVEGRGGAPATDPAILVSLWLWATIDGVGSARELDRLCERDDAYRWLCGGVGVNHHTLSDFRVRHEGWLDAQLTRSIASLLEGGLVRLEVVAQDGMRVRASAKAASFRRRGRLRELRRQAEQQVQALKQELQADAGASGRRKQAAQERAAREREARVTRALARMDELESLESKRTRKAKTDSEDDPPGDSGVTSEEESSLRVSTSDPDARVMKMADGGFRPALNVQLAVDVETQLIASVEVSDQGSDMRQMEPMHEAVRGRYGCTPRHWLVDGGYTRLASIEAVSASGTQPVCPPPRSRKAGVEPCAPKDSDSEALARWRSLMGTQAGRELYVQRGASVECANAQLRRRGLTEFRVRGRLKARAVVLWHALAHNLMRMRSLGWVEAA